MIITVKVSIRRQSCEIEIEESDDVATASERLITLANRAVARAFAALDDSNELKRPLR